MAPCVYVAGGLLDLETFEIKNFKPRDGVEAASREFVENSLLETGIEGKAKVIVTEVNKAFFFSIVGRVQNKIISNDLKFEKKDLHGWPRDWQFGALAKLVHNFIKNLKSLGLLQSKAQQSKSNSDKQGESQ